MATTSKQNNDGLISVGIDIGKEVFHLVGFNAGGKIVLRREIKRLATPPLMSPQYLLKYKISIFVF